MKNELRFVWLGGAVHFFFFPALVLYLSITWPLDRSNSNQNVTVRPLKLGLKSSVLLCP